MRKVALTGGIATGKSYVLERFRRRGVPCLDADELAHGAMVAGGEVTSAIAQRFGPHVLDELGAVDRRVLGPIVFADPEARRDLERLVHPVVYRAIAAGLRAFERIEQPSFAVVAVPLLYETGHEREFDAVIATLCRPETQLSRLLERGLSESEARRRMAAQHTAEAKAARASYVIRTDGTYAESDQQVDEAIRLLRQ